MAKMKITDDDDMWHRLKKNFEMLQGKELRVGIFGEDDSFQVMKASVHEFGIEIDVTPKMRGWFAYQGFPLSPNTQTINIPERSFIRATYDENKGEITKLVKLQIENIMFSKTNTKFAFKLIGEDLVGMVRKKMYDIDKPELSDMSKEMRKGGDPNPLVDDGKMRQSVTYKVED